MVATTKVGHARSMSKEEQAIIHQLHARLQQTQQQLKEAQCDEARASVNAIAQRARGRPLCHAQQHAKTMVARLEQEREHSKRYQQKICRDIEAANLELQELRTKSRNLSGAPREAYDKLQEELQEVVDRLAEVCCQNRELRQQLARATSPPPAFPIADRSPWIGTGLAGQGVACSTSSSRDGIGSRRDAVASSSSPVQSEVQTPRPETPASLKSSATSATSSASCIKARAALTQLHEETARMEGNVLRERERASNLAQRLDTLRVRCRQLEASLQREKDEGEEKLRRLEDQLQHSSSQIRALMELAALPMDDSSSSIRRDQPCRKSNTTLRSDGSVQASPRSTEMTAPQSPRSPGSEKAHFHAVCRTLPGRAAPTSGSLQRAASVPARDADKAGYAGKEDSCSDGCFNASAQDGYFDAAACIHQGNSASTDTPGGDRNVGGASGGTTVVQHEGLSVAQRIVRLTSRSKASLAAGEPTPVHAALGGSTPRGASASARSATSGGPLRSQSAQRVPGSLRARR